MIQIEGVKRQVYLKFIDKECVLALLSSTNGQAEYKHHTGELSLVSTAVAGMGIKSVRIANLMPKVLDDALRTALAPFWNSDGHTRDVVKDVQVLSGEWNMAGHDNVPTHSFPPNSGWALSAIVI
jgi:hypothetical protein